MISKQKSSLGIDWSAVGLYLILVIIGWLNIYAAVSDYSMGSVFDFSQKYGMQLIWICFSLFVATFILLIDSRLYHMFSVPLYVVSLLILMSVLVIGKEINGAKSWLVLGPVAFQPAEFMKFTTALMLSSTISNYNFNIKDLRSLIHVGIIIFLPILIIILQNDTGSAVVYVSFLFMLCREGLNGWIYIAMGLVIALFVSSFLLTPLFLMVAMLLFCTLCEGLMNGMWKRKLIYLAFVAMCFLSLYSLMNVVFKLDVSSFNLLLSSIIISLAVIVAYIYRYKLINVVLLIGIFFTSVGFTSIVDYAFNNILQTHQQKRILDLLGIESDLRGWGYNVNQSKIAIGSGGWTGKGFLNGTQTKYNFVPEQSTDFIFCTVGEEWGFLGCMVVIGLFCSLILKLMRMGERQPEAFGRVYCYSIAGIFLAHLLINIGMTIGIMPVIGIPLMFFSYGGSSFLMFTIMYFVAIRLDANPLER